MFGRASAGSLSASAAIVVLQECENADDKGTVPRSNSFSLGIVRSSMVTRPGHASGVSGVASPACIAAAVVMVLNVEPGGYTPVKAMGPCAFAAAFCAAA